MPSLPTSPQYQYLSAVFHVIHTGVQNHVKTKSHGVTFNILLDYQAQPEVAVFSLFKTKKSIMII